MARTVNLYEAKTQLSTLVEAAERGEEIIIAKNGVAKARLTPIGPSKRMRKPSGLLHVSYIADDFDAPETEPRPPPVRGRGVSLLLDTQVFLWFESGSPKLGDFLRRTIGREPDVYVSAASFLEIAIKQRAGKLTLEGSPRAAALAAGFSEIAIGGADAETASALDLGQSRSIRPHAGRPLPQPRSCARHRRPPAARAQRHRGDVGGIGSGRSDLSPRALP